jgi:hypothetical protein
MTEDQTADYDDGSPTRLALNVLAHKWTLLILVALKRGPQRFSTCGLPLKTRETVFALTPAATSRMVVIKRSLRSW